MINWQLSKQGIRWPVSLDRIAGSGVDPSRSSTFLKLSADKLLVFKWSQAQVYFFKKNFIWNMLCLCHYGPALLRVCFQSNLGRENSASYLLAFSFSYWFFILSKLASRRNHPNPGMWLVLRAGRILRSCALTRAESLAASFTSLFVVCEWAKTVNFQPHFSLKTCGIINIS